MKYLLIFFFLLSYPVYSQYRVNQNNKGDKDIEFCANHPTHHKCKPLPVTLLYFTGYQSNSSIILKWSTAQEKNCNYFEVLGSNDGYQFESITRVNSQYQTTTTQSYYQVKVKYYKYYKLVQSDLDNTCNILRVLVLKNYKDSYIPESNSLGNYNVIGQQLKK